MSTTIQTDVAIVGGGIAGVAAAVAAAGKGLKVVLIEKHSFLGGKATAAQVGTVCGLYKFSKNAEAVHISKGFTKDFADALQKRSGTVPLSSANGLHYLPYDIQAFKDICLEWLNAKAVTVLLNTVVKSVELDQNNIDSIGLQRDGQEQVINLKSIVDCSGESIVSRLSEQPLIESNHYQAAAQIFTLQNVAPVTEQSLDMILKKALRSAIDENKLEPNFDRVYIVQGSVKNGQVSLKIGIPLEVTHTSENLRALKILANQLVHQLTAYLVTHVQAFQQASILNIAPEVGIRVSERPLGKYVLTEDDVLSCKKTADAVANCSWPIEEWAQNRRVQMRYFELDDFYQIPVGCLQSKFIQNLLMGGRNISAYDGAIASARVMGACLQTGFAAGSLAAGIVLKISEQEVIKNIQSVQL